MRDHRHRRMAVAFDRPEPRSATSGSRTTRPTARRQSSTSSASRWASCARCSRPSASPCSTSPATRPTTSSPRWPRRRDAGLDVIVVTGDRDVYQLVEDPHVKVLYNRRGVSDYVLYDEEGIEGRTGVPPRLYLQYAALRGDPSDNLPGVPVGEKTAAKLITTYGGSTASSSTSTSSRPSCAPTSPSTRRASGRTPSSCCSSPTCPSASPSTTSTARTPDVDEVRRLFDFLEFHSLAERLTEALGEDLGVAPPAEVLEAEVTALETPAGRRRPHSRRGPAGGAASRWRWRRRDGSEGRTPSRASPSSPIPARATWRGCPPSCWPTMR